MVPRMTKDVSLRLKRRAEKATMRLMSTSICPHDGGAALIARGVYLIFLIIYYITRSYAALWVADLDWIVGPGYSSGGYILKKNYEKPTWNHEKP